MLYRVVRPFPLSLNGLTLIDLNVGDERSDWGGMEGGLLAEGYIEAVVSPEPAYEAPVPEVVENTMIAAPAEQPRRRKGR